MLSHFSRVQLFATPWTVAHQAPLSMGISRQEQRSELAWPPPGDLPNPGIKTASLTSPAFAAGLFTTSATWAAQVSVQFSCSVVSDSLQPHGLQHARPPCPSPNPRVYSNSYPSSQWCHPTISSSLASPSPPAFNLSQHQGLCKWVSSSHQVVKVLEFQLQHQSFHWIFRPDFLWMDWLDLLAVQGTQEVAKSISWIPPGFTPSAIPAPASVLLWQNEAVWAPKFTCYSSSKFQKMIKNPWIQLLIPQKGIWLAQHQHCVCTLGREFYSNTNNNMY